MNVWTSKSELPTWKWLEEAESSSVAEPAQMAGRRPTHSFLTGVNKGPFSLEKTPPHQLHPCQGWGTSKVQAQVSLEALPGPLSWPLSCRPQRG